MNGGKNKQIINKSQYLHSNTAKCLHSPTNPASGNFAGAHIDKFEGCTVNINVFRGDQSKIAMLNENWSLSDRGTNRHYLHLQLHFWSLLINFCFNHKLFHLSLYEKFCLHSLTKFVQSWTLNSYFCPVWTGDQRQKKVS